MTLPDQMEHGPQPLRGILEELGLTAADLVRASDQHLTFKQVKKGCDGRALTARLQQKIADALNHKLGESRYRPADLFTYRGR